MNIPMKEKYVDEAVGIYFVLGVHGNGNVDVSDSNKDIFQNIPLDVAQKICEAQGEFREKLYSLLCDFK